MTALELKLWLGRVCFTFTEGTYHFVDDLRVLTRSGSYAGAEPQLAMICDVCHVAYSFCRQPHVWEMVVLL